MFTQALRLARYNWPLYAAVVVTVSGGTAAACLVPRLEVRLAAAAAAVVAEWFGAASFLAFHAMFDCSEFGKWTWLREELAPPPARWLHLSAGIELTHAPLAALFPGSAGRDVDLYDPVTMPAPAIGRAQENKGSALRAKPDALPADAASVDAAVVVLAAHEIHALDMRKSFFRELDRVLAPGGRIVLVEHLRNLPALLAFGPGFLHFLPRSEWLRRTGEIGFRVARERSFTPFIRVFVCERAS
ncbi:MAG: methyltransferase domain-containing protein [Planctomycetes bacterium]|nr:methyltransferase domain-containing protein [Planctomycetota bacterium]